MVIYDGTIRSMEQVNIQKFQSTQWFKSQSEGNWMISWVEFRCGGVNLQSYHWELQHKHHQHNYLSKNAHGTRKSRVLSERSLTKNFDKLYVGDEMKDTIGLSGIYCWFMNLR